MILQLTKQIYVYSFCCGIIEIRGNKGPDHNTVGSSMYNICQCNMSKHLYEDDVNLRAFHSGTNKVRRTHNNILSF